MLPNLQERQCCDQCFWGSWVSHFKHSPCDCAPAQGKTKPCSQCCAGNAEPPLSHQEHLCILFSLTPTTKESENIKVYFPRHLLFLIFFLLSHLITIFQWQQMQHESFRNYIATAIPDFSSSLSILVSPRVWLYHHLFPFHVAALNNGQCEDKDLLSASLCHLLVKGINPSFLLLPSFPIFCVI